MAKRIRLGSDAYRAELDQKSQALTYLLGHFNDGRRKTFFCLAVNLLDIVAVESVVRQLKERTDTEMTIKEKAPLGVEYFEDIAKQKGIILKLNKKPSKAKI